MRCDADRNFYLRYTDVFVGQPCIAEDYVTTAITPQQCRLRDITYAAPITVNVEYTRGKEIVTKRGKDGEGAVTIGRMPLMLRCRNCVLHGKSEAELARLGECPLDPGGYFVVRGTEKVVMIQEQLSKNRIILSLDSNDLPTASVTSSTHERKSKTNCVVKHSKLYLKHNAFSDDVNVFVVMKGMGIESDQECLQMCGAEQEVMVELMPTIQECKALGVHTQAQALEYLGSKVKAPKVMPQTGRPKRARADEARDILAGVILAHVPVVRFDFQAKAQFLATMIRRIAVAMLDPRELDDMDYYGNKRLELAGQLLALLFEDLFKRLNVELRKQAEAQLSKAKSSFDVAKFIRPDIITYGLESAISSGNWTIKRFRMERKGMTQVLSRLSFIAATGMMTRIMSQFEKTRKVSGPRALQPSQWGMLCPADTPEGESCGLVKNLALMTHITTDQDARPVSKVALALGVHPAASQGPAKVFSEGAAAVLVNGLVLGTHRQPLRLVQQLRALRRQSRLDMFTSVHINGGRVHIATDGGRVCRPLIICDRGVPRVQQAHLDALKAKRLAFRDFLAQGLIEYVDVNEENNALIALYESQCSRDVTHLEIEPFTVLGVVAGLIPYPHHNQSPRNTYQCAMGKQAMGNVAYNQLNRLDTLLYLLCYPMRPLLTTHTIELIGFDRLGAGQNACVAVMSYSGYDIEDAIVMNKASLDRGFGRCIVLKKYGTNIKKYANRTSDRITGPPLVQGQTQGTGRWKCLDRDGLACVGEKIYPGDVYINKQMPSNTRDPYPNPGSLPDGFYRNVPLSFKGPAGEHSVVDKVLLTANESDSLLIKVLLRHTRRPELGDKFSSRHGQKGVVGNIVRQEDMPFSERGICPDLIMNPHGFPSRMTVGKMIELLGSKAGVHEGRAFYGTAFGEPSGLADDVERIGEVLAQHGFSYQGKDLLTSGISGEPLQAYIFMGCVYYQKLKHMVLDKMHARATGPRVLMTRQPTEGRSRDGGLRLGEMERDCLIAYGASMLLLERLMISSDQFEIQVCTRCKLLGYLDHRIGAGMCSRCRKSEDVATMKVPYACKLLFQELQSMNILPRLTIGEGQI